LAAVKTVSIVAIDAQAVASVPGLVAVTVLAINLAPVVVTSVLGPVVTAGSAPALLDPLVLVTDLDSANLSGATVKIGLGFAPGDTLSFAPLAGNPITGAFNSTTGVLTLSGTGTVAQYQAALQSVTFSTSSSALAAIKTVSIVVTDSGTVSSLPGLVAVTVLALPINVPPLVVTSGVRTYTAGGVPVTLDPLVTVIDIDSTNVSGATVTIGLGRASGDALGYVAPAGNPITGSFNSTTGVLTLSGTGTVAQYQAALRAITFSTSSTALAAVKAVTIVVTDAEAGASGPGLMLVTVLALPVAGVPPLVTTIPVGPVYTAGSPAVAVNPLVTVLDVDSTNLSGATVTITSGLAAGDVLSFTAPVGPTRLARER
jgi:hypothetical protein